MPDTGAPWNIPYVAGTDLVSDWPTDSQTLAEAIADALDDASLISQVVQTVKTDTFTTTSNSYTAVTGLSAAITPATATSKVLIVVQLTGSLTATSAHFRLSGGNVGSYVGDAASNRVRNVTNLYSFSSLRLDYPQSSMSMVYLDSPATTSSTTYGVEARIGATGAVFVNRSGVDTDSADFGRGASSITLLEVSV